MEPYTKCRHVRGLLPDYSAGMGSFVWKAKIRAHLAVCPACAAELKAIEEVCTLVEDLPLDHAPDLWNKIQPNLERRSSPPELIYRLKPAFAGTAALAAVAMVILASPHPQNRAEMNADAYSSAHAIMSWNQPFADTAELGMIPSIPADTGSEAAR